MNLYIVLKDATLFEALRHRLELTLYSEAEWNAARALLAGKGGGAVERAAALFTLCRQSLSGRMTNFAPTVRTRLRGGRNDGVNGWWSAVDGLEAVHHRLRDAKVLCRPALEVIRSEDTPATCFYCDPPYVHATRTAKKVYGPREMADADHRELLDTLRFIKGKAIVSGYPSDLYDGVLRGWNREEIQIANHAAGGATKRTMVEVLWRNY
jgi:DNA adenine methylase